MSKEKKLSSRKKRMFKEKRNSFQEIASERINYLFSEAERVFNEDKGNKEGKKLSDRYVFLARKLSLKYKVPFTKEQKIKFCKSCGAFLFHGQNARVRLSKGNIVIKCEKCNHIRRLKYA